ncbi:hypothetical protein TNCT_192041 [Trichonephila clavata]|uniref:Uncharacterized protein n=1 Tax=Trichonephila clavata TaxID=2740835 RepID=A0A8X6IGC6_TRICU|nr:hypothetical protein TNCT_192041 [Trichonephila clavata]
MLSKNNRYSLNYSKVFSYSSSSFSLQHNSYHIKRQRLSDLEAMADTRQVIKKRKRRRLKQFFNPSIRRQKDRNNLIIYLLLSRIKSCRTNYERVSDFAQTWGGMLSLNGNLNH